MVSLKSACNERPVEDSGLSEDSIAIESGEYMLNFGFHGDVAIDE